MICGCLGLWLQREGWGLRQWVWPGIRISGLSPGTGFCIAHFSLRVSCSSALRCTRYFFLCDCMCMCLRASENDRNPKSLISKIKDVICSGPL